MLIPIQEGRVLSIETIWTVRVVSHNKTKLIPLHLYQTKLQPKFKRVELIKQLRFLNKASLEFKIKKIFKWNKKSLLSKSVN